MLLYNIIEEMAPEHESVFRSGLMHDSYLQRVLGVSQATFGYDTGTYDFRGIVARRLVSEGLTPELCALEDMHRHLSAQDATVDVDQVNRVTSIFYETDEPFLNCYYRFLKNVIHKEVIKDDFYFQKTPTLRFHFPNESGMDTVDRFHTDCVLGHPPQQINIWLPLVEPPDGRHSFLLGGLDDTLDLYRDYDFDLRGIARDLAVNASLQDRRHQICPPATTPLGSFVVFDSRSLHAATVNRSTATRVSMDVRVIPVCEFEQISFTYRGTGRRRASFAPGDYYDERPVSRLEVD